jgi:hypothetical protein
MNRNAERVHRQMGQVAHNLQCMGKRFRPFA